MAVVVERAHQGNDSVKKKQTREQYQSWALRNPEKVAAKRERRYARERARRETLMAAGIAKLMTHGFIRIPNYPAYLISQGGVVYSTYGRRLLQIRPGVKPGGYEFVGLRVGDVTKYEMIHRLVALTFIPNPLGLPEVNHLDCRKRHNHADNLEWCTRSQNAQHMQNMRQASQ